MIDTASAIDRPPRVLMVEDEMVLALLLCDVFRAAGFDVVPVGRMPDAERAAMQAFDAAVLDINIGGQLVYPVAHILRGRGVPFLFASAYGAMGLPEEFRDVRVMQKPYAPDLLVDAVTDLLRPH